MVSVINFNQFEATPTMKPYIFPILLSFLVGILIAWSLFPSEEYGKVALAILLPTLILIIGFRWITFRRIQNFRTQLYQIFQTLEEFDVDEPTKVAFEKSPFPIFNELSDYLIELINRIRTDYQTNKQFTQNASHELQTPLAIIKGHIEILLQSPNIGEKEMQSLGVVLQNTNRLSKLNSALILLSKIEHQRFIDASLVNFEEVIEEILTNFQDLIQIQNLKINRAYQALFQVTMSETLAEILIANLLQNAIRYNQEGDEGYIDIRMEENELTISNPGAPLPIAPKQLFKRFKRSSSSEEGLGLGLSIVKRICEQSGLKVTYTYKAPMHYLKLTPLKNIV